MAPFIRVPPYENKAFLTNSVIPRPNGKFFDHEKWFLTYLIYIQEYTKNQNFHPLNFYGYTRLRGGEIGLIILHRTWCPKNKIELINLIIKAFSITAAFTEI